MKDALIQIQKQYALIPSFVCMPGCTDCCGPVPIAQAEMTQIAEPRPFETRAVCQYKTEIGCRIYEQRPLLCRLYGTVDTPKLRCPHGKQPERLLTERQGETIMRHYLKHPRAQDPIQDLSWAAELMPEARILAKTLGFDGSCLADSKTSMNHL